MSPDSTQQNLEKTPSKRRFAQVNFVLRRIHLYAGLFLLPWVFLYGITGAMYNHQGLLPEVETSHVAATELVDTQLKGFPSPEELARQVVNGIQAKAGNSKVALARNHGAEYNNEVIMEVVVAGQKHAVHINPISTDARVVALPTHHLPQPLLKQIRNVQLSKNPYAMAKQAVPEIMRQAGIEGGQPPRPRGWCKLNFLADVDGERARITYVLRDGHVDVVAHDGTPDMTSRQFFMRLHTSHGQPPHWNGRMFWSLMVDVMAIAMVTWGITGVIMWWQIKRVRAIGVVIIGLSLLTAVAMYLAMFNFYATTKL